MKTERHPVSKVTLEKAGDFKFKVAYEAYSQVFDKTPEIEDRERLNNIISQLFNQDISYQRFYGEIDQYRRSSDENREFLRTKIQGQRKRDYRRDEQKKHRIKRHKR